MGMENTMRIQRRDISLLAVAFAYAGLFAGSANALSPAIEAAKNNCIVGEQSDGYLGVVSGASADAELQREVRDINQARKANYADLSRRNGVSIDVTAKLTAEKLIAHASAGHCTRNEAGQWVRR